MPLRDWIASFPLPPTATTATTATEQGKEGELSQVSQLSQLIQDEKVRREPPEVSHPSLLSQPFGDLGPHGSDAAREAFEERSAITSRVAERFASSTHARARVGGGRCVQYRPLAFR